MRPHRRQPTRLPRPWDSPGKNTGVGCHFLLQCMKVKSESRSVVSNPQRPRGPQPSRLLCPWDFPGKSTGVGCHCLLRFVTLHGTFPHSRIPLCDLRGLERESVYRLSATSLSVVRQAPLSMGFSRPEYWSGLPCPPPGDLPHPRIRPTSAAAPALQTYSLPLSHCGRPTVYGNHLQIF